MRHQINFVDPTCLIGRDIGYFPFIADECTGWALLDNDDFGMTTFVEKLCMLSVG